MLATCGGLVYGSCGMINFVFIIEMNLEFGKLVAALCGWFVSVFYGFWILFSAVSFVKFSQIWKFGHVLRFAGERVGVVEYQQEFSGIRNSV